MVELVNNQGVRKFKDQAAVIDPAAAVMVHVKCKVACKKFEWRGHSEEGDSLTLKVEPGEVEFVGFRE